jgi:hypothetical protein
MAHGKITPFTRDFLLQIHDLSSTGTLAGVVLQTDDKAPVPQQL